VGSAAFGQSIEDGTQFQLTESGVQWMQSTVSMFGEEMAEDEMPELDKPIMRYEDGSMINIEDDERSETQIKDGVLTILDETGEAEIQFLIGEQDGRTTLAFNVDFLTAQIKNDPSMQDAEKEMATAFLEQMLGGMGALFIAAQ
jgi:hypothetical protein